MIKIKNIKYKVDKETLKPLIGANIEIDIESYYDSLAKNGPEVTNQNIIETLMIQMKEYND